MLIENDQVPKTKLMGFFHQALAGVKEGLKTMGIRLLTLPPGAETPSNEHHGQVIGITLKRTGCASIGKYLGEDLSLNKTLVIPAHVSRKLTNTG